MVFYISKLEVLCTLVLRWKQQTLLCFFPLFLVALKIGIFYQISPVQNRYQAIKVIKSDPVLNLQCYLLLLSITRNIIWYSCISWTSHLQWKNQIHIKYIINNWKKQTKFDCYGKENCCSIFLDIEVFQLFYSPYLYPMQDGPHNEM